MQRLWFTSFFSLLLGTGVLFGQGTALNPAAAARARERGLNAQTSANQSNASQNNTQQNQATPGARIAQPPGTQQAQPPVTPAPAGAGNPTVPGAGPFVAAAPTPQAPSTPAEMPPVPPQVTYRDGLLTVNAPNSSLSTVISAIRAKTGIEFEGIDNMAPDRLALTIGPAPESDVLAAIFDGSRFDYVVVGRTDSPNIVQRVVLTPKQGAPPQAGTVAMRPQQRPPAGEGEDEDTPDEQVSNGDPEPQDIPNQPPVQQQAQQPQNPQPQQQGPTKSPEQLLQELRQMQQQQQQKDPGSTAQPNPNVPRKPPL